MKHIVFAILATVLHAVDHDMIFEKDRLYVNPKSVLINENGIFLQIPDGAQIPLTALFSDSHGCYTSASAGLATVYPVITCRNCKTPFSPTIFDLGKCPHCGFRN